MNSADAFEVERSRLTRIATRVLDDAHEAEDVVQNAWLRFREAPSDVVNEQAWLTTVTTRLCLDRLRARIPLPAEPVDTAAAEPDPVDAAERAEQIGQALHVVIDTLTPDERVAFILTDTFGFDSASLGTMLSRSPAAVRQLVSRARRKLVAPEPGGAVSDWQVVDAFMTAARGGDLERLLTLLAPDVTVTADAAALLVGTPASITGRAAVAEFFNGSAHAALPVFVDGRPGSAWFHRGQAKVAFDFTVGQGRVLQIVFRAEPALLRTITGRKNAESRSAK